jgi:hypothetical protein
MADFQLILLSGVNRSVREARPSGAFSLIPFPKGARAGMESSALSGKSERTPEDIATWYSPSAACRYAETCMDARKASDAIRQLLIAGMIEVVATSSSMTPSDRGPITDTKPIIIPNRFWKSMSATGTDLWNGAYARFWIANSDGGTTYQFFGIKLNPHDVQSNLPPPRPPDAIVVKATPAVTVSYPSDMPIAPAALAAASPAEQATSDVPDNDVANKGPPVAPDHLKAWFDLYRRVYSGSSDTEANALVSARGMFPGKSVSRDSVRALRGAQKRGRKPDETAK